MTWIIGISIFICGLFIGMVFVAYRYSKALPSEDPVINELKLCQGRDLSALLSVYRRELANYLILINPKRFLKLYQSIEKKLHKIDNSTSEVIDAEYLILSNKYYSYSDFDSLDTYDFALYADTYSQMSIDEIEVYYTDNVIFHHLNYLVQKKDGMSLWNELPRKDGYLEFLKKYTDSVDDTILNQRLILAFPEFEFNKDKFKKIKSKNNLLYETSWFSVYFIPDRNPSTEYGFHFNQIDEFGIVDTFLSDDYKNYINYYRSDINFEKKNHLNDINIERLIVPIPFVKDKS